jgi:hypothetical protein
MAAASHVPVNSNQLGRAGHWPTSHVAKAKPDFSHYQNARWSGYDAIS